MAEVKPGLGRILLTGAAMGLADAVPGVSGGTIALICGIYDRLLAAIAGVLEVLRRPLTAASWHAAGNGLAFLVPLYLAVGAALWLGLKLLVGRPPDAALAPDALHAALAQAPGLLINPATAPIVFAAFFGLVAATMREPWGQRTTRSWADWPLAALGAALAAALSLSPAFGAEPGFAVLVGAGALAIAVMLLPGVSGSLMLLVLGLYQPVAAAAHTFDLAIVVPFAIGIGLGAAGFVPLLRALLRVAHDRTMAFLAGLMAGSLVALWPWKAHYLPAAIATLGPMQPQAPQGAWWWTIAAALAGAAVVPLVRRIALARGGSRVDTAAPCTTST